jgi:hypothetical protein
MNPAEVLSHPLSAATFFKVSVAADSDLAQVKQNPRDFERKFRFSSVKTLPARIRKKVEILERRPEAAVSPEKKLPKSMLGREPASSSRV